MDGFTLDATERYSGQEDAEEALAEASEVGELLEQLKSAAAAQQPSDGEDDDDEDEHYDDDDDDDDESSEEEDSEKTDLTTEDKKPLAVKKSNSSGSFNTKPIKNNNYDVFAGLVPQLEARLQALQSKLSGMEERSAELEASNIETENALRDSRIAVEIAAVERDRLSAKVREQEKAIAAAEALAAERKVALETEAAKGAALAAQLMEMRSAQSKAQVDTASRWQSKIAVLSVEVEKAREEVKESQTAAASAAEAAHLANSARIQAEENQKAAEQRAVTIANEVAQLRARSSQALDQSEQMRHDNERRSKSFNAAVEVQVQRFKSTLEAERDAALSKLEEAHQVQEELQQQFKVAVETLQRAEKGAEDQAALVVVERAKVAEYEQMAAVVQTQAALSAEAAETAAAALKIGQTEWEKEKNALAQKLTTMEEQLQSEKQKTQQAETKIERVQRQAAELQLAAKGVEAAQIAINTAKEEADAAAAESIALKIQVSHLQRELEAARSSGGDDVVGSIGSDGGGGGGTSPSGKGIMYQREMTSPLPSFDLESLRRMPLLSSASRKGAGGATEQRSSRSSMMSSTRQLLYVYLAMIHILLLVQMGRASRLHLACEHLQLGGGGLP